MFLKKASSIVIKLSKFNIDLRGNTQISRRQTEMLKIGIFADSQNSIKSLKFEIMKLASSEKLFS